VTKKRAERLTGYEIRDLPAENGLFTVGAFDGEELVIKAVGRADFIALKALVNGVYMFHSREAMKQHDWRCARCRLYTRLEIHHRKYRSHGGTHRIENLEPVCRDCHKLIHQRAIRVSIPNPRTLVRDLAAAITSTDYFARNRSGVVYAYGDGVYRPNGELLIRQRVKHLLLNHDCCEMWSRALAREVVEFITLDTPEFPERPSTELINLENGLLKVTTRELFPHSPELLSSIRIPIRFDPNATCPAIEQFVSEIFSDNATPLAWEILGDLLIPERSIQKAICLLGEGGNGKSAFLDLATTFIGEENVCHMSLQRLEADRFSAARLYGKLANICPDLPNERLTGSATFKAITGCDRITAEFKYHDSFEFTPFVRLLFSANQLPGTNDSSQAFFDRWLVVPFSNRFRHTRHETPRNVLQYRLSEANELSGALNKALEGLERMRTRGRFTEPSESAAVLASYQEENDILATWLDEHTVSSSEAIIPQSELHAAFVSHCTKHNNRILSKQAFGRRLKAMRPQALATQRTIAGLRTWVYTGISLPPSTDLSAQHRSLKSVGS
jgi:P4 family phage/plasmid primase-like protien